MRVAFLGPEGTFSHAALLASAATAGPHEGVPCTSERDAVLAVAEGAADRALVPVENSIEGGVNATIDALVHEAPDLYVIGEEVLPVSHALIAAPGVTVAEVTAVVSHPQPLAQCRHSLDRLLPGRERRAVSSTAEAVRQVAGDRSLAALGPAAAAEIYGCELLASALEDEADNATRFWWLARERPNGAAPTDAEDALESWRTSVVFDGAGDERPGWLLASLAVFAGRGLNLTRIESRPSRRRLGHYVFLIDVAGDAATEPLEGALRELEHQGAAVRVLGSYRIAR